MQSDVRRTVVRRLITIGALVAVGACGASGDVGSGSATVSATCPGDPGFGLDSCNQNEWWLEFSVSDATTTAMQVEVSGSPTRIIDLPTKYALSDGNVKFTGGSGNAPVPAGTLIRVTATHPVSGGTQSASTGWFAYMQGTPVLDCPDASTGADATSDVANDTTLADGGVINDASTSDGQSPGIGAMPHVSVGKPAFASEGTASLLTDGAYRSPNAWRFTRSHCKSRSPCWGAVHVGSGPSRLLVDFSYEDGEGDFDTRVLGGRTWAAYSILVSANSTNGRDGTWSTAVTVSGNPYIHRSHLIDFAGYSWVKLAITSSSANEVDELDLWDASSTTADSYFFHGDSITHRCANLRGTNAIYAEQPSFQADVQAAHSTHYPLQIGGGIVGQGVYSAANAIGGYLTLFQPVKYWFLTMGTNDLCSGASYFSAYAQTWINAVKAAGAVPILVHPIWANNVTSFCSQNGASFNSAIDALVESNGLLPAVPLYEATVDHPEYFDPDDVHPNALGCHVWNQTFANAVSSFY